MHPASGSIRGSLKASTTDGIFAAIFSNTTSGVLLTNFLLELGAAPTEIGVLAAIPLLANLLQPIGAFFSERFASRQRFCLWIYAPARSLWVLLIGGIVWFEQGKIDSPALMIWTLAIALLSCGYGALGSAPWLSWMAHLVPSRLRGRYFGIRNSAANLTNLISIPLLGLLIARWQGGSIQGYGIALTLGIIAGFISLAFQSFMRDLPSATVISHAAAPESAPESQPIDDALTSISSPSLPESLVLPTPSPPTSQTSSPAHSQSNFHRFLIYCAIWTFSLNLSAPFFNLYLLDNLSLNLSQVTLYNSLMSGANLLMLILWGKLADRIGNRPILLGVGAIMGLIPLLWWLINGHDAWSIWIAIPLLHLLMGMTTAAIDLCSNTIQMSVAPLEKQSTYFGIVAAIAGVSGAIGTLTGGFLAQGKWGVLGVFALSAAVRWVSLIPLVWVQEDRSISLRQVLRSLVPTVEIQDVR